MINKQVASHAEAVSVIRDGATILISGFGGAGVPFDLIDALIESPARGFTTVSNNAGIRNNLTRGLNALIEAGKVRKVICSYPQPPGRDAPPTAPAMERLYKAGQIEYECVPQGTLVERMRAGGSGLGPFFTPTGYGTPLADGKETRVIDGRGYVLEQPIRGDFALVRAHRGDRWGNLVSRYAGRNFVPVMCMAANHTIAEVEKMVPLGELAPDHITTPSIFVQAVVPDA